MTLTEVIDTLQTWIRNADDEYDREEMGRVAGLREALHEIKKIEPCEDAISRDELPKWIPVSERLPEDGTWNLFTDGRNISVERYKNDAIDHFYPNGRWFSLDEVTAWMPLPKPYKAESEE